MSYYLLTVAMFIILKLSNLSTTSPVYDMQPAFLVPSIGLTNGRNIRNLPCVSRKNSQLSGVCMFAIDCYKANGTHLGTCVDRFYFGSCCHVEKPINHQDLENTIENENVIVLDNREPPQRKQNTTLKVPTKKPTTPTLVKVPIIETTTVSQNQNKTVTTSKKPIITTSATTPSTSRKPISTTGSTTTKTTTKAKPTRTSTKPRPTQRPSFRPPQKPSTKPTRRGTTTTAKPAIIKPSTRRPTSKPNTTQKTHSQKPLIIPTTATSSINKITTTLQSSTTTTVKPTVGSSTFSHHKVENVTVESTTVAALSKKPIESTFSTTITANSTTFKPVETTISHINLTQNSTTSTTVISNNNVPVPLKQQIESTTYNISSTSFTTEKPSNKSTTSTTQIAIKPSTTEQPIRNTSSSTISLNATTTSQIVETVSSTTLTSSASIITSTTTSSTTMKPVVENTTHDSNFETFSTVKDNGTISDAEVNTTEGSGLIFSTITTTDRWVLLPNVTPSISTGTILANISTSTITTTTSIPLVETSMTEDGNTTANLVSSSTISSTIISTSESPEDNQGVNMSDFTDVCGRRLWPQAKIVGGEKSSFGRWPWQISLRQWRTSTYLHKCGAALLNENWAITAAHCVDNVPPSDLLLRLGEHDLSNEEDEPYLHEERRIQIVASHPNFDPRTFEYDLALLRFYEPVEFRPNILPICVPANDENFVGRTAYVTGWGRLYEDGPLPSVLQEVSVPIVNNSVCETMYKMAGYVEHIPEIFICAGWRKGGFDSCEGDSGGPLVIQREDKRFLLAGIISWGIGCAEPNQPGVYTRISQFRVWINKILQF